MRVLAASSLLSFCCLVAFSQAVNPPSYDSGSVGDISYVKLAELERWAHRVAEEKIQLGNRLNMLKDQKSNLLDRLEWIYKVAIISEFDAVQNVQDAKLGFIKDYIKVLLHRLGEKEGILSEQEAVTQRLHNLPSLQRAQNSDLQDSNDLQDAKLAKTNFTLTETFEKLYAKLSGQNMETGGQVFEVLFNTRALTILTNTRKCWTTTARVPLNDTGFVAYPQSFFKGYTPTAFCALTGFSSRLTLDSSHAVGYGGSSYDEETYQVLAITVDCKPFNNFVTVHAFDGSKGGYNSVDVVYVDVRVCTFGPQVGPDDNI